MEERGSACKPKICFVGHSFHRRTRSSKFFISILREFADVREFYSNPDEHDLDDDPFISQLAISKFDLYVFWQSDFIAERLHGLNLGRFVLVPMFDGVVGRTEVFWRQFTDCQFISFSRAHHELLQQLGCRSSYFQFWPEPKPNRPERDCRTPTAFFWERRPDSVLNLPLIVQLSRTLGVQDLYLHAVADFQTLERDNPATTQGRGATVDIRLIVSRWFESPHDFDAAAGVPLFYFAPRQVEGIGMAVLEAMGRGQIVVSPDAPTMNEYVSHGVTGILFDVHAPAPDFAFTADDLARMSRAAHDKAKLGRARWLKDVERLKSILLDDGRRWSSSDFSSHFLNKTRQAASHRAFASGLGDRSSAQGSSANMTARLR